MYRRGNSVNQKIQEVPYTYCDCDIFVSWVPMNTDIKHDVTGHDERAI